MKQYKLKNDTMNESEIQRVCNYPIYPRYSKIHSHKRFVIIDNGQLGGGTHLICFIVKDIKLFYFDSFGGAQDKFLINQMLKSIIYHNYKIKKFKFQIMWLIMFILSLFN